MLFSNLIFQYHPLYFHALLSIIYIFAYIYIYVRYMENAITFTYFAFWTINTLHMPRKFILGVKLLLRFSLDSVKILKYIAIEVIICIFMDKLQNARFFCRNYPNYHMYESLAQKPAQIFNSFYFNLLDKKKWKKFM